MDKYPNMSVCTRPVVYVAGPFRPKQPNNHWEMEGNIRRAEELALNVWRTGAAAVCPHTNTRFYQNALPDEVWLEGDIAILDRCDAVIMTEDWKVSSGATEEHTYARLTDKPVFYELEKLKEWVDAYRRNGGTGGKVSVGGSRESIWESIRRLFSDSGPVPQDKGK